MNVIKCVKCVNAYVVNFNYILRVKIRNVVKFLYIVDDVDFIPH